MVNKNNKKNILKVVMILIVTMFMFNSASAIEIHEGYGTLNADYVETYQTSQFINTSGEVDLIIDRGTLRDGTILEMEMTYLGALACQVNLNVDYTDNNGNFQDDTHVFYPSSSSPSYMTIYRGLNGSELNEYSSFDDLHVSFSQNCGNDLTIRQRVKSSPEDIGLVMTSTNAIGNFFDYVVEFVHINVNFWKLLFYLFVFGIIIGFMLLIIAFGVKVYQFGDNVGKTKYDLFKRRR